MKLLSVQRDPKGNYHHCGGVVKLWDGIFSGRKHLKSFFHCYGDPMKLVHASLDVRKGIHLCRSVWVSGNM